MKKNILLAILFAFACTLTAQNNTMYIMKSGAVVGKFNTESEVDSIIFYEPKNAPEISVPTPISLFSDFTVSNSGQLSASFKLNENINIENRSLGNVVFNYIDKDGNVLYTKTKTRTDGYLNNENGVKFGQGYAGSLSKFNVQLTKGQTYSTSITQDSYEADIAKCLAVEVRLSVTNNSGMGNTQTAAIVRNNAQVELFSNLVVGPESSNLPVSFTLSQGINIANNQQANVIFEYLDQNGRVIYSKSKYKNDGYLNDSNGKKYGQGLYGSTSKNEVNLTAGQSYSTCITSNHPEAIFAKITAAAVRVTIINNSGEFKSETTTISRVAASSALISNLSVDNQTTGIPVSIVLGENVNISNKLAGNVTFEYLDKSGKVIYTKSKNTHDGYLNDDAGNKFGQGIKGALSNYGTDLIAGQRYSTVITSNSAAAVLASTTATAVKVTITNNRGVSQTETIAIARESAPTALFTSLAVGPENSGLTVSFTLNQNINIANKSNGNVVFEYLASNGSVLYTKSKLRQDGYINDANGNKFGQGINGARSTYGTQLVAGSVYSTTITSTSADAQLAKTTATAVKVTVTNNSGNSYSETVTIARETATPATPLFSNLSVGAENSGLPVSFTLTEDINLRSLKGNVVVAYLNAEGGVIYQKNRSFGEYLNDSRGVKYGATSRNAQLTAGETYSTTITSTSAEAQLAKTTATAVRLTVTNNAGVSYSEEIVVREHQTAPAGLQLTSFTVGVGAQIPVSFVLNQDVNIANSAKGNVVIEYLDAAGDIMLSKAKNTHDGYLNDTAGNKYGQGYTPRLNNYGTQLRNGETYSTSLSISQEATAQYRRSHPGQTSYKVGTVAASVRITVTNDNGETTTETKQIQR